MNETLKAILESKKSDKGFKTSLHSVKKYSRLLNRELFEGKLAPVTYIDIRRLKRAWRKYSALDDGKSILHMYPQYKSFDHFINVLAHELIHHYQHLYNEPLGHGKYFKKWEKKFKRKGLSLRVGY